MRGKVLSVNQVADTTLAYDLDAKRQLYAQAGIPEYWVIDITKQQLVIFHDLQGGDYVTQLTVSDGVVYSIALPEVAIAVQPLVSIPE
ncbi:MAG: Uma2 family endonuclease [Leptolyngbyaceae bacterium]|nr:Uma2 family endonuclease [Leptolyngbyaceae bacterium]